MNNEINSENLSSIIFFSDNTYASGATQAEYLAGRNYGAYVEGLGTLSKTDNGDSYWSNYENIIFEETEFKFTKLKEIYNEALTYASNYIEDYSGCVNIQNGRYTAKYSYQHDLDNDFNNAETVVFNDLKNFLCSLNYQTFNKSKMYNGENEVNSIRIGIRTFNWHYGNEVTYSELIEDEYTATYSYSYNYITIDENDQEIENTYSYSYDYIVPAVYLDHHFESDNYYAYVRKNYVPIDEALINEISYGISYFENTHSNNVDNYTYYMNEFHIEIPMTLNTYSIGTKKSTFVIDFDSDYDSWFYDVIKFNADIDTNDEPKKIASITSGVDNAVFSLRKNENERFSISDVTINNNETLSLYANGTTEDTELFGLTTPYKMKELDLSNITEYITGTIDVTGTGWTSKGNMMKSLILGAENVNSGINKIFGLNNLTNINYLNLCGLNSLSNTPSISNLGNLKVLDARESNITAFKPKEGSTIYEAWLPETINSIKLNRINLVNGALNVMGSETDFFGRINYTPTSSLRSFTCLDTPNVDTYNFVKDWITVLKNEDKLHLSELIYLELNGINWNNVPIQMMYDIKEFDLDVNESTERKGLAGNINVTGTGNYGLLTIEEYSKLLKLYGRNALLETGREKVFSDLKISLKGNAIEPYEFYLKVSNSSIPSESLSNKVLDAVLEFSGIENGSSTLSGPISAISFIEILKSSNRTLRFEVDKHEKYAYCKLNKSIDTTNSKEETPKAGDIMLFNGDTILIFLGKPTNNYKYVKLGSITDQMFQNQYYINESVLNNWFKEDIVDLHFGAIEKPVVTSSIDMSNNFGRTYIIPDSNDENDQNISLSLITDEGGRENLNIYVNSQVPPVNIYNTMDGISLDNASGNSSRDIETTLTAYSTYTDEYVSALGLSAEDLVRTSFDLIVARAADYDENDNTVTISDKLYTVENDTLISIDDNVMSISEDEESITITLK